MKRASVVAGLFYLLAAAAAAYKTGWALPAAAACLFLALILFCIRPVRRRYPVYLLAIFFAGLGFSGFSLYYHFQVEPYLEVDGVQAQVTGTVYQNPEEKYGRYSYMLTDVTIQWEENTLEAGKIQVYSYEDLDVSLSDVIEGSFYLYQPENIYSSLAKGIQLSGNVTGDIQPVVHSGAGRKLPCLGAYLQQWIESALNRYNSGEEAGVLKAVLLGDKSGLSRKTYESFINVGGAHLLAVSGQHLTMFLLFLSVVMKKLKVSRTAQILISVIGVVLFAAAAGFSGSILRSGIMCLLTLIGRLFYREADGLNSLGIAVLLMSIVNPYTAFDLGFVLSVLSTLGILLWSGKIERRLRHCFHLEKREKMVRKILGGAISSFSLSIAATVAIFPVSVLVFGKLSWLGPLINILLLYPFSAILLLSLLIAILGNIPVLGVLSAIPSGAAWVIITPFLWLVNWLGQLPFISLPVSFPFVQVWLCFSMCLISVVLLVKNRRKWIKITAVLSGLILVVGGVFHYFENKDRIEIDILQGGTSVVVTENGKSAVIGFGGYGEQTEEEILFSKGIRRVEVAVMLEGEYDSLTRLLDLNSTCHIENIFMTDAYIDGYSENKIWKLDNTLPKDLTKIWFVWDDIVVACFKTETDVAVALLAGSQDILICSRDTEISHLPAGFRDCDILISDGVPDQWDLLSCRTFLFTGRESRFENIEIGVGVKAACTETYGGVRIRMKDRTMELLGGE